MDGEDTSFRGQLEERIATYRGQCGRIRGKLVELNRDLNDVERRLEAAEELYRREFGLVPPGSEPPRRPGRKPRTPGERGRQDSWRDAIVSVLNARGQPLHVKEIWQALVDSGFQTASRDPLRSIVSIVVRDSQIERTAPNTYGLCGTNSESQMSLDGQREAVRNEGGAP